MEFFFEKKLENIRKATKFAEHFTKMWFKTNRNIPK